MPSSKRFQVLVRAGVFVALTGPHLFAQATSASTSASMVRRPSDFGLQGSVLTIGAASFVPTDTNAAYVSDGNGGKFATSASGVTLAASVNVPTGSLLNILEFEIYDNDPTGDVTMTAFVCGGDTPGSGCSPLGSTATNGMPGWEYVYFSAPEGTTVDNLDHQYMIQVTLPSDSGATVFRRAIVFYQQQVSAAPATARFNDVPTTDPGFQYIEALAASGITGGCGGGNYCPDNAVTRRQIAVFLSKALGLYWSN